MSGSAWSGLAPSSPAVRPAAIRLGWRRRCYDAPRRAARGVWSPVEVLKAVSDPDGVTLLTDTDHVVRARSLVFCCGYEFPKGVPTPGAEIISTWAMASKPRQRCPAWLRSTLVWEASDPYLYLRMGGDGRLIVGGEDEASAVAHEDKAKLKRKREVITAKLRRLLPDVAFETDYGWAGAFGESATGLPNIGPVMGMDHTWAVMGFGGNGITYSVIASQIVAAEVRGKTDPGRRSLQTGQKRRWRRMTPRAAGPTQRLISRLSTRSASDPDAGPWCVASHSGGIAATEFRSQPQRSFRGSHAFPGASPLSRRACGMPRS
ncbi:NAD(P)/FAD-dependent oxidoreductase [Caulobacter sp. UC70_42]|uniref:NAD(P)/FAD-dependent oxidoreductase n=1 Tax=Caulobacter sp. UC70_42 TaxID=3374551 RepID=UPI003756F8D6